MMTWKNIQLETNLWVLGEREVEVPIALQLLT